MSANRFYVVDERLDVVVVDSDPVVRQFATVYLSSPVARVTAVDCGCAALARLRSARADIMLLALDLPGMSGFDVLELVRADPRLRRLPVIAVANPEDTAAIDRAYALGATSFAIKPLTWRLLAHQTRYVLRASRGLDRFADEAMARKIPA